MYPRETGRSRTHLLLQWMGNCSELLPSLLPNHKHSEKALLLGYNFNNEYWSYKAEKASSILRGCNNPTCGCSQHALLHPTSEHKNGKHKWTARDVTWYGTRLCLSWVKRWKKNPQKRKIRAWNCKELRLNISQAGDWISETCFPLNFSLLLWRAHTENLSLSNCLTKIKHTLTIKPFVKTSLP